MFENVFFGLEGLGSDNFFSHYYKQEMYRETTYQNKQFSKTKIWITWLIFIDFIFWPSEVVKFWRLRTPGSSEVKKEYQNGIRTSKTYDLTQHMTFFHWFNILTIFGGHYRREVKMEVWYPYQFQGITYVVAKSMKAYLIHGGENGGQWPQMSNFLVIHVMTTIRGCMPNFSLLSQLLETNAACTKFGVTKCRIATPPVTLSVPLIKNWNLIYFFFL